MLGGMFYEQVTLSTLVVVIALICLIWAFLIIKMPNPSKKICLSFFKEFHLENSGKLNIDSIDEWYINNTENVIAIKYDNEKISEEEIKNLLK